jgi:hypothetical protein
VLEPLEPLSLFNDYDPARALVNGDLPGGNAATLLLIGSCRAVAGLTMFLRRNLLS